MVYLLVGIQGSGKSTFAEKLSKSENIEIISTDSVRKNNKGIEESKVWDVVYKNIADAIKEGRDVIFDSTAINTKVRKRFFDRVQSYGVKVVAGAYYFDLDPDECFRRVQKRNEDKNELYLPPEVVYSYQEKLEKPELSEGFIFIKTVRDGKVIDWYE